MLSQLDAGLIIQILAIAVPLVVATAAFIWRRQEKQDDQILVIGTKTTVLETRVEDHGVELEKGTRRFEGVSTQIGELKESLATTQSDVKNLGVGQTRIEKKIDGLVAKGS